MTAAAAPSSNLVRLATMRGFLGLALPLAAGFGVNWAMQFTNRLFLSWSSPDALAASMPAGMLVYMIQSFFSASVGYAGAFAAQHVGAGEPDEAGAMAWPMVWLAVAAGLLAAAISPCRALVFSWYGATPAVTAGMVTLGGWYLAETFPAVLFAGLCGWFGGLGRTRLVLLLSLVICIVSVGLNRWLIFGGCGVPALGLHGAGLATLLATSGGALAALAIFFGPGMRARYGTWRQRNVSPARLARFARAALPRGGTEALEMVAIVLFTAGVAHLGSEALAANNLVFSLYLLVLIPLIGLGQGITIAVGQTVGAGRIDLAQRVVRQATIVVGLVLAGMAVLFLGFPETLMRTHVDLDPQDPVGSEARWERIIALGLPLMWLSVAMAVGDGLHIVWRFAVQGAGDTRWPMVVLTTTALLGLALPVTLGIHLIPGGIAGLSPLTACWALFAIYLWMIGLLMWWRYRYGPWRSMSLRR